MRLEIPSDENDAEAEERYEAAAMTEQQPAAPTQPRTEAGQALLADMAMRGVPAGVVNPAILAIEAAARAAGSGGLTPWHPTPPHDAALPHYRQAWSKGCAACERGIDPLGAAGSGGLDVPDYQYEMLEDVIGAGWSAIYPTTPRGQKAFNKYTDDWLLMMEKAFAELRKLGFVIARLAASDPQAGDAQKDGEE